MEDTSNLASREPAENSGDSDIEQRSNLSHRDRQETGAFKTSSALFVAATLIFVWSIVAIIRNTGFGPEVMMLLLLEAGMLAILGFLARKKPFTSLIIGLILFFAIWLVTGAMDKASIYSGIIIKIFIVFWLLRVIPDARRFEKNN